MSAVDFFIDRENGLYHAFVRYLQQSQGIPGILGEQCAAHAYGDAYLHLPKGETALQIILNTLNALIPAVALFIVQDGHEFIAPQPEQAVLRLQAFLDPLGCCPYKLIADIMKSPAVEASKPRISCRYRDSKKLMAKVAL